MPVLLNLSPQQAAVQHLIYRFGMVSSSQVRRALYKGTPRGTAVRARRHLHRLVSLGVIKRLEYGLSRHERGGAEGVYVPVESKARTPNLHTLGITELYAQLVDPMSTVYVASSNELRAGETVSLRAENGNEPSDVFKLEFAPEPWSKIELGGVSLEPDAHLTINGWEFFIELDRASEAAAVISGKLNRYLAARERMTKSELEHFPTVLFISYDADRRALLQRVIHKKPAQLRDMFASMLFDEAVEKLRRLRWLESKRN